MPTAFIRLTAETAAGVRLRLITEATRLEIRLAVQRFHFVGAPSFEVFAELIDGDTVHTLPVAGGIAGLDLQTDKVEREEGEVQTLVFDGLPGGRRLLEVWLPHSAVVDFHGVRADAPVDSAGQDERPHWINYGSSISHNLSVPHPTGTWQAVAARELGWRATNLGFAGNAMLDPFVARAIRDTPADVISLKLGINLVNFDSMTLRTFRPAVHGFLDTIREGQAAPRIVVISPISSPPLEHSPGPSGPDETGLRIAPAPGDSPHGGDSLTLVRIRAALEAIVEERRADDPAIEYLDGRTLLSESDDAAGLMPDGLHPGETGTRLMGERFAAYIRGQQK
ncbi:GDSL-type esterase/lipase family protein [Streptomyces muensis]|uniref:GDSL-type esterase/lipase family protein n=1 Tax=Streptomyces muensis TaxID=1077944 RepID=A0A9X1PTK9_STRM4|nr:GDSL-type esterase/lipase family protein [Streptomyces muensis]MCF1592280.1 GDSL-type esterase/lipase family protein [Streptomyces muensis]